MNGLGREDEDDWDCGVTSGLASLCGVEDGVTLLVDVEATSRLMAARPAFSLAAEKPPRRVVVVLGVFNFRVGLAKERVCELEADADVEDLQVWLAGNRCSAQN